MDLSSTIVERAAGILRQCIATAPAGTAYQEFAERVARSYSYMVPTLLEHLAIITVNANPELFVTNTQKLGDRTKFDAPTDTERDRASPTPKVDLQPRGEMASAVASTKSAPAPLDGMRPKGQLAPVRTYTEPAPAPIDSVNTNGQLAPVRTPSSGPTNEKVSTRQAVVVPAAPIRPVVNPPRVPLAAIASSNRRLAQSILDTWTVNGKKYGDCLVGEVLESCNNRDRATSLMRAVVKDLPLNCVVRAVMGDEEAQERFRAAQAALPKRVTLEATQPKGYRHVG